MRSPQDALKRSALAVAMLSSFLTPFMAMSVNIALPTIANEFSMDAVLESWVATSYLLAAAVFLVPFGRIADIKGRKRTFVYGIWIFTVSSVLCALAPDALFLLLFRIMQGFGSAMIFGTAIAILTSVYPLKERGKALGYAVAVTYLGLSVGPFVGGLMTGLFGWRSIFLVGVPIGAATVYATRRLTGEWAEARGEAFDLRGSVIYGFSLTAVIFGFSLLPDPLGPVISLAGLSGMLVFIWWELRQRSPVLDMRLFRDNRTFTFSNIAALINYCATFAVGFLMSLYLQYVKGMTPEVAGIVLVSQPVVMAVFSPVAGKLSDVVEPQIIASVGMTISAVGLVMLALLTSETQLWFIVFSLAFLGFGFALFSSPNTNAIMSSVERKSYGVASASVSTMRLIGQVLSIGIATLFIAVYVGTAEITPAVSEEFLESFNVSFVVFAVLCFAGIFASLARGKVRKRADRP